MTWLAWRQFRAQSIAATATLGALAIVLAATGPHLASLYSSAGLTDCHANCGALAGAFIGQVQHGYSEKVYYLGIALMCLTPAVIGIFWGAPLIAREFEEGTHRLAWNQSVTRTRWAVVKLGLVGLAAIATAGLLSLMVNWWARPIDKAIGYGNSSSPAEFSRITPVIFDGRGVAPLGYAAFAFALGVTAGVVLRRTIPAMAVTLVVFAAVQVFVPTVIRPNIFTPDRLTVPITATTTGLDFRGTRAGLTVVGDYSKPGAWILSDQTITPAGHAFAMPHPPQACLGTGSLQSCFSWLASRHLRQLVTYQPASRFWPLQWTEMAIYLVLAAGLGVICLWQVRRRQVVS
ncbi:MAG TPA: ABC transporter permease [Streptosporangiaceae bacterium]|nr:ABC transporter permease [Streptosporangiaceae bacterium]